MSFDQFSLHPRLVQAVGDAGYTSPTPIQREALPPAMAGRDVLGLAQTGTGKTAAFVLPILHRLASSAPEKTPAPENRAAPWAVSPARKSRTGLTAARKTRALVVAPTRELAEQIHDVFLQFGARLGLSSAVVYGGVGKGPQEKKLRQGVDIIVACPGRLLDHLGEGAADLSGVRTLVLDEADRMFDMGFFPDLKRILSHLPEDRQTLLFSATMPDEVRSLADGVLKDPSIVEIGLKAPAKTVSHGIYPVRGDQKLPMLLAMLDGPASGRVLIFARTKHRARKLCRDLERKGHRVSSLRGDMAQNARRRAMEGFRDGRFDILVATDIAARGIDVTQISHVINFDMPDTADAYTHRIGRTGRAGLSGEAFTIAVGEDLPLVRDLEKTLRMRIPRRRLDGFDYDGFTPEDLFPVEPAVPHRVRNAGSRPGGRFAAPPGERNPGGGSQSRPGGGPAGRSGVRLPGSPGDRPGRGQPMKAGRRRPSQPSRARS